MMGGKEFEFLSEICNVCGKEFSNEKGLYNHQLKEGHMQGCECEECGKQFTKDLDLERHCLHTGHMIEQELVDESV